MRAWHLLMAMIALLLFGRAAVATCPSPTADHTVPVPGRPFAAEPSSDNCRLFVALADGREGGAVAVLANDGGHFRVARSVAIPRGGPGGLSLSHDGKWLAVAAGSSIVLMDAAKLATADADPLAARIEEGAKAAIYTQFSKDDALLFVAEERNASVAVIDVAAALAGKAEKAVIGRMPVGQAPVGLALSPDGARLYSTSQSYGAGTDCAPEQPQGRNHAAGALIAVDVAKARSDPAHAVAGAVRAGCNPVRVVMAADGHSLWVSQRGDGRVMGIDPSAAFVQGAVAGAAALVPVGKSPVGLAIRPDGAQLWVANSDRFAGAEGSLSLVTPATPGAAKLTNTLKVGAFPRDLRFLPDGKTLVVALFGSNAVLLHPTG